jgi:hypothetical protein
VDRCNDHFELLDTDKRALVLRYFQAPDKFIPMSNPSGQIYKATLVITRLERNLLLEEHMREV